MNNIKSTISNHNKHTIQEKFSLQQKCFHNNVLWEANVTLPQGTTEVKFVTVVAK